MKNLLKTCLFLTFVSSTLIAGEKISLDPNEVVKQAIVNAPIEKCNVNQTSQTTKKNESLFLTLLAVESASQLYNRPYPNAPHDKITLNGVTIYRPNHGLAHGMRSAFLAIDIVDLLLKKAEDIPLKNWLKTKLESDPDFIQKLAMISLAHRAGREDEADSIGDYTKRARELAGSVDAFKKIAQASGIIFKNNELEDYADAIRLDGKSSTNIDRNNLSHILRAAHIFDLIRLNLVLDNDVKGQVSSLNSADVADLFKKAEHYLILTGDMRHAGTGSYDEQFVKLSANPKEMLDTFVKDRTQN